MSATRWVFFSILILLAAAGLAAVLTPSIRQAIQEHLGGVGREILATAEGDVLNDSSVVKIIKYRDRNGLWVEVVKIGEDGKSHLVDNIALPDRHDGLFNFQGHVTRLAIADVDHDGSMEVIAPSFDQQLIPHLNVFKYNKELKRFEPFNPNSTSDTDP